MLPEAFFAAGTTLANLQNLETVIDVFNVLDGGRIPSLPPVKTRALDGFPRRDGKINAQLMSDVPTDAQRVALNVFLFGNQVTAGAELYISALDDTGHYSPYLAIVERPFEQDDYQLAWDGKHIKALVLPLFDCRLQSVSKASSVTITTGERLVYVDTSGGNRTMTLPPLASVSAYTIYSFVKTSASNDLVLDPDGSELVDGASTKTVSAASRIDIYKAVVGSTSVWRTLRSP